MSRGFEHMTAQQFTGNQVYPRKNPQNVYHGKRNQERGEEFERILLNGCEHYWQERVAKIEKLDTPYKVIRSLDEGKFIVRKKKKSGPDFQGPICGGQQVYFEAKHTDDDRIYASVMQPHQWTYLNDYYEMGAIVFVMLSFRLEHFYRVPWWVWRDMQKLFGHKHINRPEIAEFEVPGVVGVKKADQMVYFLENYEDIPVIQLPAGGRDKAIQEDRGRKRRA